MKMFLIFLLLAFLIAVKSLKSPFINKSIKTEKEIVVIPPNYNVPLGALGYHIHVHYYIIVILIIILLSFSLPYSLLY